MAKLGYVGYQVYDLPGGLLVVGAGEIGYLGQSSKADQWKVLCETLDNAEEEDIFFDHKINRNILTENA